MDTELRWNLGKAGGRALKPHVVIADGVPVGLVHDCNALCGDNVRRMFRNRTIKLDNRWKVIGNSLKESIKCEACGLHGHWINGKWVPVK